MLLRHTDFAGGVAMLVCDTPTVGIEKSERQKWRPVGRHLGNCNAIASLPSIITNDILKTNDKWSSPHLSTANMSLLDIDHARPTMSDQFR